MSLSIEHKGMQIRWSDNEDQWTCMEMRTSSPSLAKIKSRIDTFRRKQRKEASVTAIYLSGHSERWMPCEVVEYLGKKGYRSSELVAVMRKGLSEKPTRNEDEMTSIALDTPENRAAVARANELAMEAHELTRQAREIMKSIPRLTKGDIPGLIEHADTAQEVA